MSIRSISLLGATGSIGAQVADLVAASPETCQLVALSADKNDKDLLALARRFRPRLLAVNDPAAWQRLSAALADEPVEVLCGEEGQIAVAACGADVVIVAAVGMAALAPALAAVEASPVVALANKECLVSGGALLMAAARTHACQILPLDSEHHAIFQLLAEAERAHVAGVILTASGGPFLHTDLDALRTVTPAQAVRHPVWSMGAKISVDSATMMNKGLELIEAQHLFGLAPATLSVLIHPQALIHALIEFADGSLRAQLAAPDMRVPLAAALAWPEPSAHNFAALKPGALQTLELSPPDRSRFPCLALAEAAQKAGGAAPVVLNAANEEAVAAFLCGRIGFTEIAERIAAQLDAPLPPPPHTLAEIVECDGATRRAFRQRLDGAHAPVPHHKTTRDTRDTLDNEKDRRAWMG